MTFFLIAGETSGDQLGAALMAGMRQLRPDVAFTGIGGPQMMAQGMDSLFPMDELSLMGIWEVLPKFRHLKRRIAQAAEAVIAAAPEALITIEEGSVGGFGAFVLQHGVGNDHYGQQLESRCHALKQQMMSVIDTVHCQQVE